MAAKFIMMKAFSELNKAEMALMIVKAAKIPAALSVDKTLPGGKIWLLIQEDQVKRAESLMKELGV